LMVHLHRCERGPRSLRRKRTPCPPVDGGGRCDVDAAVLSRTVLSRLRCAVLTRGGVCLSSQALVRPGGGGHARHHNAICRDQRTQREGRGALVLAAHGAGCGASTNSQLGTPSPWLIPLSHPLSISPPLSSPHACGDAGVRSAPVHISRAGSAIARIRDVSTERRLHGALGVNSRVCIYAHLHLFCLSLSILFAVL
jgi:hypothetical protein